MEGLSTTKTVGTFHHPSIDSKLLLSPVPKLAITLTQSPQHSHSDEMCFATFLQGCKAPQVASKLMTMPLIMPLLKTRSLIAYQYLFRDLGLTQH